MREQRVALFNGREELGFVRLPDSVDEPYAGVAQGLGWLGLKAKRGPLRPPSCPT